MTNVTTKTKEELLQENRILIDSWKNKSRLDVKDDLRQIKENQQAIKQIDKEQLLKNINSKYSRLRGIALQAWECEQPTEDITTADGSFHKTKVKKYPKIAALQYASAKWENNKMLELRVNGEKFYMYQSKHEYNKETVYTRQENFAAFLQFNSIPENDMSIEEYISICDKLTELNTKLQADIESYKKGLTELKTHTLNCWGLTRQNNVHLYEYLPTIN